MKTKFIKSSVFVIFATTAQLATADIPDRSNASLRGMYQIASSNDPIFPMTGTQEWFLDFGQGIRRGTTSGSVAVSVRQNPNVKVRIMAWEFFPAHGALVIGNPYAEGSQRAVARGAWKLRPMGDGVILQREGYQVILHRADPNDY